MIRFKPIINYNRSVCRIKSANGAGIYTSFTMAREYARDGIILGSISRTNNLKYIQTREDIINSNICYTGYRGHITTTNSRTKKFNTSKKHIDN